MKRHVALAYAVLLPAIGAACRESAGGPAGPAESPPPPHGSLEVMTTSAGNGHDADGYALSLNGVPIGAMAITDTVTFASLPAASYAVALTGADRHCKVGGGNPRGVRVEPGRTTRVIFVVKCDPEGDEEAPPTS